MKTSITGLVGLAAAALAVAGSAMAASYVTISGSGLWSNAAPSTDYSQAGESYSFTFKVLQTYPVSYTDTHIKQTTSFTGYQYKLNGAVVPGLPDNITFFDSTYGGGFALGYPTHSVEFIGPDIGSTGTVTLINNATFYPNMDYVSSGGVVVNEGTSTISAVPEPAAWTLSFLGFGAAGGMMRSRRRAAAA